MVTEQEQNKDNELKKTLTKFVKLYRTSERTENDLHTFIAEHDHIPRFKDLATTYLLLVS